MAAATKDRGSKVGLVSCACWEHHATLRWEKTGFFIVLTLLFTSCGLLMPYITTVARNTMPPLLPLISQSGGAPPSNGVFAVFSQIGLYFAIFPFPLLFVSINQRNGKNHDLVRRLNSASLMVVSLAWIGLALTVCFPVGYTDLPNKFQWVVTVLYEHSLGASLILIGLAFYQFLMIGVSWWLPDATRSDKYTRIAFGCAYCILFLITLYPLPAYMIEELGPNPFDLESMKTVTYSLPLKYTIVYQICSVCEWAVCILSSIHLAIFYKDLQRVSLSVVFRHKSCLEAEPGISLKTIA